MVDYAKVREYGGVVAERLTGGKPLGQYIPQKQYKSFRYISTRSRFYPAVSCFIILCVTIAAAVQYRIKADTASGIVFLITVLLILAAVFLAIYERRMHNRAYRAELASGGVRISPQSIKVRNFSNEYHCVAVFCGDYYVTGVYKVRYSDIDDIIATRRDANLGNVRIYFEVYKNGTRQGHDIMYEQDFEYLKTKIGK